MGMFVCLLCYAADRKSFPYCLEVLLGLLISEFVGGPQNL